MLYRTRVQLPPAPPKSFEDDSRVIHRSRKPAWRKPAGFFVSAVVREHSAKTGDYWYTFRYTVGCIPKRIPIHEGAATVARTTRPLTNTEVLRAKALVKDLTLHDGDGLFLIVKTSGKKLWRFRYQRPVTKQRTMMGLGAFPTLSLADARGLRADYLALLANGIDPQIQTEVAEEEQQMLWTVFFRPSPLTGSRSKAKALPLITQKIFGAHWRKMYLLPSVRSPFSKSKPEYWLKPLSQSKLVGRVKLYVDWYSILTR